MPDHRRDTILGLAVAMALAAVAGCGHRTASGRVGSPSRCRLRLRCRFGRGRPGRPAAPRVRDDPDKPSFPAYSATARVRSVEVHAEVDGPVQRTLADPTPSGGPLVLLVQEQRPGWLRVQLPVRPNGSTGWVRASDVTVAGLPYRLDVRLAEHQLEVYRYGVRQRSYPIGVGTQETPTPGGTFYLKELLRAPDPSGPYGPYAYGLSGFSNTLTSFDGGDGVIGIHGTNEPAAVGRDVSHGCIRLHNADIVALTHDLPLGTPVRILA